MLIEQIKDAKESELIVFFKKDANFYENSLNLKIIKGIAEDVSKTITFEAENKNHKDYIDSVNGDYFEYTDDQVDLNSEQSPNLKFKKSIKLFSFFSNFRKKNQIIDEDYLPEIKSSNNSKLLKILIYPLIVLGVLLGIGLALWWYIPAATVKINVNSQILVKLLEIKASVDIESVAAETQQIPAFKVNVSVTDSQTIPTTGKKETGEKAEGKVTLFNKTNENIKIKKGTVIKLISTNDESWKYETTSEVDVSAQSEIKDDAGTVIGTEYGKKDVEILAIAYGDKYNQKDGQNFEINGFDTDKLVAENTDKIDGGSAKEVNVVAQTDIDSLKRTLNEFMQTKVAEAMQKKVVEGQTFHESSVDFTVVSGDYDKKLDDEADELTLTMVMGGSGLAYSQADLDALISELIKTIVPAEYDIDEDKPDYEVAATKSKTDENVIDLQVKLRSYITPKLNESKIKNDLTGMKIDEAQDYLNSLNNIKGFEIILSPKLPPIIQTLPHQKSNIKIEITKD